MMDENIEEHSVETIPNYIDRIIELTKIWPEHQPIWFRGEPERVKPLIPSLYRGNYNENMMLQTFRARAQGYYEAVPHRDNTDQWLFLAQHVGIPTRLLDWTENALIALHFSLLENANPEKQNEPKVNKSVVWILNPLQLNLYSWCNRSRSKKYCFIYKEKCMTCTDEHYPKKECLEDECEFPLPWHESTKPPCNIANMNIRGAWERDNDPDYNVPPAAFDMPVAVPSSYIHQRMLSQRSCFTVHGTDHGSIKDQVSSDILKKIIISHSKKDEMLKNLRKLGITHSTAFPDLDHLAKDLKTLGEETAHKQKQK